MRTRSPSCRTMREHAERQRAVSCLHGVHLSSLLGVGHRFRWPQFPLRQARRGPQRGSPYPGDVAVRMAAASSWSLAGLPVIALHLTIRA